MTETNAEDDYREIGMFAAATREHFGGMVKLYFPQIVDAIHFPKAKAYVEQAAALINEPVMLSMAHVEQIYVPEQGWLRPVDHDKLAALDQGGLSFATIMSGATWVEPEYLLDIDFGKPKGPAELRVKELREAGLRSLKGDWAGAEDAPEVRYTGDPSPL